MIIGLVQSICSKDKDENVAKALDGIRDAAKQGAQIICLPELFASHYFCQTLDESAFELADKIPGPLTKPFEKLAKKLEVVLILPVFEERGVGLCYNSAVVIDADGKILGTYRKMHIPNDSSFQEKFFFAPGDKGFLTWKTKYGTIGVCICWDQWFPESARSMALMGAEVLFYPTGIGWIPEDEEIWKQERSMWEAMQRSHAFANGCYVAAVNRVGLEKPTEDSDGVRFWGSSFVCDPKGTILKRASSRREEVLVVECDRGLIKKQRHRWPLLRDRRPDAYTALNHQWIDQ